MVAACASADIPLEAILQAAPWDKGSGILVVDPTPGTGGKEPVSIDKPDLSVSSAGMLGVCVGVFSVLLFAIL